MDATIILAESTSGKLAQNRPAFEFSHQRGPRAVLIIFAWSIRNDPGGNSKATTLPSVMLIRLKISVRAQVFLVVHFDFLEHGFKPFKKQ